MGRGEEKHFEGNLDEPNNNNNNDDDCGDNN